MSISITQPNTVTQAGDETKKQVDNNEVLNNDFADKDLQNVWRSYAATLPIEETRMISYINTNVPERIAGTPHFMLRISNSMQEKELLSYKHNILSYLRSELKNSFIDMVLKMNEAQEARKILSPEEKYKQMALKNPALIKLRTGLGFEID